MKSIYSINTGSKSTYQYTLIVLAITLIVLTGCKRYLEIDAPITSVNGGNVYKENSTAIGVLTAMYAKMTNTFAVSGVTALSLYPELSADNLTYFGSGDPYYTQSYQNSLTQDYLGNKNFWINLYPLIYSSNAAIEGLNASTTLNAAIKQRLLGEAYFIRAFCYFYLVNLYGDVPLVTSTDFNTSFTTPRQPVATIYQQMVTDLNTAKSLLDNRYLDATLLSESADRVRPNAMAATALLARVQLYNKQYGIAERLASEVINQTSLYSTSLVPLNQVFLKNSKETIFALQPVKNNFNTDEGNRFILIGAPNAQTGVYASTQLMTSFDVGDQRKNVWIGFRTVGVNTYPYPAKYKVRNSLTISENTIVLRLAEQYLIRAEAKIQQTKISEGIADLNVLRSRADDPDPLASIHLSQLSSTLSKDEALKAVLHERQVELFTEWGHRWFDLKRVDKIDEVMKVVTPLKGGVWSSYKALYPIPVTDIRRSSILTQNPGYVN